MRQGVDIVAVVAQGGFGRGSAGDAAPGVVPAKTTKTDVS
jgi:hypothetical protein